MTKLHHTTHELIFLSSINDTIVAVTGSSSVFCGISGGRDILLLSAIVCCAVSITYTKCYPTHKISNAFFEFLEFRKSKNCVLFFRNWISFGATQTTMHLDVEINKKRATLKRGELGSQGELQYSLAKTLYKKYEQQVCNYKQSYIQTLGKHSHFL